MYFHQQITDCARKCELWDDFIARTAKLDHPDDLEFRFLEDGNSRKCVGFDFDVTQAAAQRSQDKHVGDSSDMRELSGNGIKEFNAKATPEAQAAQDRGEPAECIADFGSGSRGEFQIAPGPDGEPEHFRRRKQLDVCLSMQNGVCRLLFASKIGLSDRGDTVGSENLRPSGNDWRSVVRKIWFRGDAPERGLRSRHLHNTDLARPPRFDRRPSNASRQTPLLPNFVKAADKHRQQLLDEQAQLREQQEDYEGLDEDFEADTSTAPAFVDEYHDSESGGGARRAAAGAAAAQRRADYFLPNGDPRESPFFNPFGRLDPDRMVFWSTYADWSFYPHVGQFRSIPDLFHQLSRNMLPEQRLPQRHPQAGGDLDGGEAERARGAKHDSEVSLYELSQRMAAFNRKAVQHTARTWARLLGHPLSAMTNDA